MSKKHPTVLIVVWEKNLSQSLEFVFQAEQWGVSISSSFKVLGLLNGKNIPDLIVLDWFQPQYGGEELCRHIRRLPQTKCTPILAILPNSAERYRNAAKAAGATDYISLPMNLMSLAERSLALLSAKVAR